MNVHAPLHTQFTLPIHPAERTGVFIDGLNLYHATRALGFEVDYRKLLDLFKDQGRLVRAFYYTAMLDDAEYSPLRPLVDWLDYNGYTVVRKTGKEPADQSGRRRLKANIEIELAIDVLEMTPHLDHIYLFSGDADFRRLVEQVQRQGRRVTVISTFRSQPPLVADELRRQADAFVDLLDLGPSIARGVVQRSAETSISLPGLVGAGD